jgi:hypothetical protein
MVSFGINKYLFSYSYRRKKCLAFYIAAAFTLIFSGDSVYASNVVKPGYYKLPPAKVVFNSKVYTLLMGDNLTDLIKGKSVHYHKLKNETFSKNGEYHLCCPRVPVIGLYKIRYDKVCISYDSKNYEDCRSLYYNDSGEYLQMSLNTKPAKFGLVNILPLD